MAWSRSTEPGGSMVNSSTSVPSYAGIRGAPAASRASASTSGGNPSGTSSSARNSPSATRSAVPSAAETCRRRRGIPRAYGSPPGPARSYERCAAGTGTGGFVRLGAVPGSSRAPSIGPGPDGGRQPPHRARSDDGALAGTGVGFVRLGRRARRKPSIGPGPAGGRQPPRPAPADDGAPPGPARWIRAEPDSGPAPTLGLRAVAAPPGTGG